MKLNKINFENETIECFHIIAFSTNALLFRYFGNNNTWRDINMDGQAGEDAVSANRLLAVKEGLAKGHPVKEGSVSKQMIQEGPAHGAAGQGETGQ